MFRIAWSNLLQRPARTFLTAAAVALSVALVVSTTSGYRSAEVTVRAFVDNFLLNEDFRVTAGGSGPLIPASKFANT